MTRLRIQEFSCIDWADVEMAETTIVIGPQASGKSVISKLLYFFHDALNDMIGRELDFEEMTISSYTEGLLDEFKRRFPPQAWGSSSFKIEFISGEISVRIMRHKPRKGTFGNLKIEFSDAFTNLFDSNQEELKTAKEKASDTKIDTANPRRWELVWKIRQKARERMKELVGVDYVSNQLFIPAGRSFFTSMGKAVVAFEHGGFLDPLTIRFGQYFLALREHLGGNGYLYRNPRNEKVRKRLEQIQEDLSQELFSGKIKVQKNEEYIESPDGRKTPFSLMSSGQQELLPLWVAINFFIDGDSEDHLVYIEEPEAHLFPSAQGKLTEYLVTLLETSPNQKMLITTHSPYILSKLNNQLKAGSLSVGLSKKDQARIEKIVPKAAWLKPRAVASYAIIDRRVISVMGDDGLIDADYLDAISGDLSRDFNSLLEIEYVK